MKITFLVNGTLRTVTAEPMTRLLDILRRDLGQTGTKEGCGEGECGACAVLLDGRLVNACLVPALQLEGRRVVTIEGLGTKDVPDPVQTAFMEEGAAQCGFCIPGMIIASRALLEHTPHPSRGQIREALAGNLCRCTGYERIVRAVERAAGMNAPSAPTARPCGAARQTVTRPTRTCGAGTPEAAGATHAPATTTPPAEGSLGTTHSLDSLEAATALLATNGGEGAGDAVIVAGATDLLVDYKRGWRPAGPIVDISRVPGLDTISLTANGLRIGATATFDAIRAHPQVRALCPAVSAMAATIGAPAIQNRATLGGNLASASPAADAPPILMALGASVHLGSAAGTRELPLATFFTGYRQTQRRPDELILAVEIPIPGTGRSGGSHQAFYKVGTRRAQAISKLSLGAWGQMDPNGRLVELRLAAGSVAPTPLALPQLAERLGGRVLAPDTLPAMKEEVVAAVTSAIAPISDVRSSAAYRATVLGRLVHRFLEDLHAAASR